MSVIQVQNLSKQYGSVHAVDNISFQVEPGTLFGFLGVNGAGKSTTIHMLSTLLTPTSGTAVVCGKQLGKENEEIRKRIGIVYQQNCLDNLLTVEENLLNRAYLYEQSTAKNKEKLFEVCRVLELESLRKSRYQKLSGGQKRKCEIAAALMHTPELLFLDEPTTGLDPATRKNVWSAVNQLQSAYGMTVFLTTHYMEEAAQSEHIVILDQGKIAAQGTPFELKDQYASDTIRLYSETPELVAKKLEGKAVLQISGTVLSARLKHTLDSFTLLEEVRELISGFEVIQGTMDDVFLNLSGKPLEMEEER